MGAINFNWDRYVEEVIDEVMFLGCMDMIKTSEHLYYLDDKTSPRHI